MTTTPPATFLDKYTDPTSNPFGTDPSPGFTLFQTAAAAWNLATVLNVVVMAGDTPPKSFIGLVPFVGENAGRTRVVHSPQRYPNALGVTSTHDNLSYAFTGDITAGTAVTVVFDDDSFGLTAAPAFTIFDTLAGAVAYYTANPAEALLPEATSGAAGTTDVRVPTFIWVPPQLIPQLLTTQLTPWALIMSVLQPMDATLQTHCATFIQWAIAAATRRATADTSSPLLQANDSVVPLGEPCFLEWRKNTIELMLPGLRVTIVPGLSTATTNIANLVGDLVTEQRNTRADATRACTAASQPCTVSEHFKTYLTQRLLQLTGCTAEADLPQLWTQVAAAGGKRERETIDANLHEMAQHLEFTHLVPIATPDLTKKITSLRLAGSNMDNLAEGLNPFIMICGKTNGACHRTQLKQHAIVTQNLYIHRHCKKSNSVIQ